MKWRWEMAWILIPFFLAWSIFSTYGFRKEGMDDGMTKRAPVVVGGMGGSGTRGVASLFQEMGVLLTSNLATMDCHCIPHLKEDVVDPILRTVGSARYALEDLDYDLKRKTIDTIRIGLSRYVVKLRKEEKEVVGKLDEQFWGFKEPSTYYLLPFWKAIFPDSVFVHVVRDGRDMAFSGNHMQALSLYEDLFVSKDWNASSTYQNPEHATEKEDFDRIDWNDKRELALMNARIWNKVNVEVYRLGQEFNRMGWDGYHLLRTEDVVEGNSRGIHDILEIARKVGLPVSSADIRRAIRRVIKEPLQMVPKNVTVVERYGRWQEQAADDPALFHVLWKEMERGLETFGYL